MLRLLTDTKHIVLQSHHNLQDWKKYITHLRFYF